MTKLRQDLKSRVWHTTWADENFPPQRQHRYEFRGAALAKGVEIAFAMKPEARTKVDAMRHSRVLVQHQQTLEGYNIYRLPGNEVKIIKSGPILDDDG